MSVVELRPADQCRWDLVSLGEVMLRLDPGEGRIATTRSFRVWEGGGEYNVARALKRCFGLRTAVVTALADNPVGRLIEDLMYQGGVDHALLNWVPYDGIGRQVRNGLNFTERGFGVRAALGCSDRANSAASQMRPGDVDWEQIFGVEGARWFHCGGIFAALSDTTAELALEAAEAAQRHGTIVSYDINYRPSLWKDRGGTARAIEVNQRLVDVVDVLLGNEEDFSAGLGYELGSDRPGSARARPRRVWTGCSRRCSSEVQASLDRWQARSARRAPRRINDWSAVVRNPRCDVLWPMDGRGRDPRSRRRRRLFRLRLFLRPARWR